MQHGKIGQMKEDLDLSISVHSAGVAAPADQDGCEKPG